VPVAAAQPFASASDRTNENQ